MKIFAAPKLRLECFLVAQSNSAIGSASGSGIASGASSGSALSASSRTSGERNQSARSTRACKHPR